MYDKVLEILQKIRPDVDYDVENHLLTDEVFDSFDVISILAEISDTFSAEIDPDDVTEEYFDDIDGIVRLIEKTIDGR